MKLFALAAALLSASTLAQFPTKPVHMTVTFGGTPVGENTYVGRPDGSFDSTTNMTIGSIKIASHVAGKLEKGALTELVAESSQGPVSASLSLKNGKLTVKSNGKEATLPFNPGTTVYFGSFHPQFNRSLLSAADFDRHQAQAIKAMVLEGGSVLEPKVTPLKEKSIAAGVARLYRVELGMVAIDYAMSTDGTIVGMDVPSQKLRMVADAWDALYEDPFKKYPELSQATFKVKSLGTQKMKTRDGVELVQDVYVPDAPGKYPVVFIRTPYDRRTESAQVDSFVRRGYAVVLQDCRGRTDSGGEWFPFVNELNDGYDALDWISKQPWCDGNIGMIGGSYDGFVQWAAAASHHPALKCIIPQVSPPLDAMRNLPYDHGIFFLYGDVWWGKIVRNKNSDMSTVLSSLPNPNGLKTLPLSKVDDATLGYDVPFFNRWLEQTTLKDWQGWNFYGELSKVKIPALHISGWWDGDEIGTNLNWEAMRRLGRKNQWLIYGPWTHFFNSTSKLGDTDYGETALIDLDTLYVRWFDTWLKHKDVGLERIPRVQAFVTGANRWVTGSDWPLPPTKERSLFLSAEQPANGWKGKGRLIEKPLRKARPSEYTYDPHVDEIPASILNVDPNKATTKADKGGSVADLLYFVSAPLVRPMAITGPYEVTLTFKTTARDTDFFVSLADVAPNWEVRVFGQGGKLRASYLAGFDKVRPLTPGRVYTAKIRPWDSAHELQAGHRLGLFVRSSGFPLFARNLGTAEPIKNATKMVVQHNTILLDAAHPSSIKFRVLWE